MNKLLPASIDGQYRGYKTALWLLGALVLLKGAMGINSILNGYQVATTADGIPLERFTQAGAAAVLAFLALWGWCLFLMSVLGVLALVRYRAMVPLMFLLLLVEQLGRKLILTQLPITQVGSSPAYSINLSLLGLMIVGLILSLLSRPSKELS
jgi:hypothetical protein